MPNLYSIQFEISPPSGKATQDLPDELLGRIAGWIQRKYRSTWKTICIFPSANKSLEPVPNHRIDYVSDEFGGGELIRIRWTHPADTDNSMWWTTDITIARVGDRLQFALHVGATSTSFIVKPVFVHQTMGRPRIVTEVITDYACYLGSDKIYAHEEVKQVADIPAFVQENLLNIKRTLPIVVVSHNILKEEPLVHPDVLQSTILGFANVAVIDKWAAFQLSRSLGGKLRSCYNGCIRVYWPGFTVHSDPMQHDLYYPIQIQKLELIGESLGSKLFDQLSEISALRFSEGEVIREARLLIDSDRAAESERTRQQLQQGARDAGTLQDLLPLYDLVLVENSRLIEETKELQKEKSELSEALKSAESNWSAFIQHQTITLAQEPDVSTEAEEFEPDSVLLALEQAELEFCDDLYILDSAKASAESSEFARPSEVYQALMAIKEVGRLYFDSAESGKSMGGWAEQLSGRGFQQYKPTESDTVKNDYRKYGRFREFVVNGVKRKIYQHLDLGGASRKDCIQIYFEADKGLRKTVIAYCGNHLAFPRQR
jgi:hypothetical protein